MKKRLLPAYLASSLALLLPTPSTAVQAPEPFIELEAMKMFCTVRTDLSQSDAAIVQEISANFSMPWAVRLHPQASPELQVRFERILQMLANVLDKNVGGFEPGVYPVVENTMKKEQVYQASVEGEIDHRFPPEMFSDHSDGMLIAQGGANQPPSSGSGFGENALMSGGDFPSGFANEVHNEIPVEVSISFTAADVFEDLVHTPVQVPLQLVIEDSVVPAKIPARLSTLPKVSSQPVPQKKPQNLLGWLHKVAIKNWLTAEVITPLTAAFLLLFTPFGGDILASKAPEFLRRRRRFSLA